MDDVVAKDAMIHAKDAPEMDADELRLAQMGMLMIAEKNRCKLTRHKATLKSSSDTLARSR
jgi:hypothetical protein